MKAHLRGKLPVQGCFELTLSMSTGNPQAEEDMEDID